MHALFVYRDILCTWEVKRALKKSCMTIAHLFILLKSTQEPRKFVGPVRVCSIEGGAVGPKNNVFGYNRWNRVDREPAVSS